MKAEPKIILKIGYNNYGFSEVADAVTVLTSLAKATFLSVDYSDGKAVFYPHPHDTPELTMLPVINFQATKPEQPTEE